jgi:hypothetical protein
LNFSRFSVVRHDLHDALRHLLPVCADILDGGRAGGSRDTRQAFEAGKPIVDTPIYQSVPGLTRLDREHHAVSGLAPLNAGGTDEDNGARKTIIRRHDVAPSTHHEHRLTVLVTSADGCDEGILVRTVYDLVSRSTQA